MNVPSANNSKIDEAVLAQCIQLLERLCDEPELCLTPESPYSGLLQKISLLNRRMNAARKREASDRDQRQIQSVAIRDQRKAKVYGKYPAQISDQSSQPVEQSNSMASVAKLAKRRLCYICKQPYTQLNTFYDSLCPGCAEFNWAKRNFNADLSGRAAIVTGGRIKIGFQIALKLLRSGASVGVTSRFPHDTLVRYQQEDDCDTWLNRLKIFSADFRYLPTVHSMCELIRANYDSLDILVNNAAQTVRRPPEYYEHLLAKEVQLSSTKRLTEKGSDPLRRGEGQTPFRAGAKSRENISLACKSNIPIEVGEKLNVDRAQLHIATLMSGARIIDSDGRHSRELFPVGSLDADGQQIDRRSDNSWIANLENVQLPELLEVHAVNALVPFILIQNLQPLLERSENRERFVVNVSAMEGHFGSGHKTGFHPHTNMAKAAMNMITRTCAERFAELRIYMNSVDTGWVTNEYPLPKTEKMQSEGFEPPLDEIDGAARVLDPVLAGIASGTPLFGKFLKDYRETNW